MSLSTHMRNMADPTPPREEVWTYSHFYLGVDLGQVQDYTALALMEHKSRYDLGLQKLVHEYALQHLERFVLGTEYPAVVERLCILWDQPFMKNSGTLLMDQTGVGRAVVDMARDAKLPVVGVTLTGGTSASYDEARGEYHVPKVELIGATILLAQSGQLKIIRGRAEADVLVKELGTFKIKRNTRTDNLTYESASDREHDDLVIAASLDSWLALRERKRGNAKMMSLLRNSERVRRGYNPLEDGLGNREGYDPLTNFSRG